MTIRVSVKEAQERFSDLLAGMCRNPQPVVIEQEGEPVAALISPEQFEIYVKAVMQRFEQAMDELHRRNVDKDPDEVLRDVTAIVEEVRQEQYELEQRRKASQGGS